MADYFQINISFSAEPGVAKQATEFVKDYIKGLADQGKLAHPLVDGDHDWFAMAQPRRELRPAGNRVLTDSPDDDD